MIKDEKAGDRKYHPLFALWRFAVSKWIIRLVSFCKPQSDGTLLDHLVIYKTALAGVADTGLRLMPEAYEQSTRPPDLSSGGNARDNMQICEFAAVRIKDEGQMAGDEHPKWQLRIHNGNAWRIGCLRATFVKLTFDCN